ncbi:hypothetical protein H0266_05730 [Halobacillus locisalis]|uniref:DUF3899 domain-containing protein n=1 Tax=Halobacillus locisalis TaxID=220753 RepID=A0A838CR28_9BACI|nr:hypothetical protein [Halobacillus locisalis]MBA2174404.1 hypothetical protein [Halobacillus locisalis]
MKKIVTILFTIIFLVGVNIALTVMTDSAFIDFSFVLGLAVAFIIRFFNSSGGFTTRSIDLGVQSTTGIKQEAENKKFVPSVGFYTCLVYAGASLIITFIYYMEYFV